MSIEKEPINFEVIDDEGRASLYADNLNVKGIEAVLKSIPKNVKSLKECVDCDCDIPEARQNAYPGVTRCVPCQTTFDLVKSRYR